MTSAASSPAITRILVLGGGFAGITAVLELEKRFAHDKNVEILLVNRENFFLFTPMLSEVAIGTVDARHILTPIRELCHKTEFHRGEIKGINLQHQTVDVLYNNVEGCLDTLHYDHLILAMGSTSNVTMVPGVDKYAYNFREIGDALVLRNHILEMFERADTADDLAEKRAMLTFSVIGGGYSGVEVAAAIQEMANRIQPLYPTIKPEDIRVVLIEAQKRILGTLPEDLAAYAHKELEELGIEVQVDTRLTHVYPTSIELHTGQEFQTYTTVWVTGIVIPPLMTGLPVPKDIKGRPLSTPELRLSGFDNVWAIGDNVLTPISDKPGFYPPTAQIAVNQGAHVVKNLARSLQGKPLQPFCYTQKGELVVLGERSAVAQIYGFKIRGFLAWVLWRLFYLSRLPRWKRRVRVASDWVLSLFGPIETTQLKIYPRQEPCDIKAEVCERLNIPEATRPAF